MKKELSDEQIDALMRTLIDRSAADDSLLSEIADSPATWWGVSRKINEQKAVSLSAWPPVSKFWRWLMAGVPVTAAAVLLLSLFVFRPAPNNDKGEVAIIPSTSSAIEKPAEPITVPSERTGIEAMPAKDIEPATQVVRRIAVKHQIAENRTLGTKSAVKTAIATKVATKEEIKTEFIALSYARDPESGQIVRVKVPSSMMVSLGLVTSVKTPSELVDAEVLVGDDGLTRAIRFIR